MKEKLKALLQDQLIRSILKFFLLIIALFMLIGIWKWKSLPPQLPLFYSLPRSNDQLGTPITFLILPFISLILFGLNLILASFIYVEERLGALILIIIGNIISLLLLITFIKIIFLIT